MSEGAPFDRILASLHDAMFDDAQWSATSALIDDACRTKGNVLAHAEGDSHDEVEINFAWFHYRGERLHDLESEYFGGFYPQDERIPRLRLLPDSRLVQVADLYTREELKTSAAYNDLLSRSQSQNGLNVRLNGPNGSRIIFTTADPVDAGGWSSTQVELIREFLPHLRQFVRVRQGSPMPGPWVRPSPGSSTRPAPGSSNSIGAGGSWQRTAGREPCFERATPCTTRRGCSAPGCRPRMRP